MEMGAQLSTTSGPTPKIHLSSTLECLSTLPKYLHTQDRLLQTSIPFVDPKEK